MTLTSKLPRGLAPSPCHVRGAVFQGRGAAEPPRGLQTRMRPGTHKKLRESSRDRGSAVKRTPSPQAARRTPIAFQPAAHLTPAASPARSEEADPTPDSGARADFCPSTENTLCCPAGPLTGVFPNFTSKLKWLRHSHLVVQGTGCL